MRYIIFYIAAALMLAGCAKETELDTGGGTTGEEGDVTVVMSLNVPCAATTRALNQTQEEAVHTVDILVFDKTLKLVDWQYGQLKTSGGEVSFSAMLKASKDDNDKFRIVVLANVRELTYAKLGDGQFEAYKSAGKNYDFIVGLLETSVPSYAALGLKGVPMWGELQDPVKLVNNTTNEYDMDLLRSLARIDVGTNSNPQYSAEGQITGWTALTNFSLEEVRVYNAQTHYALTARPNYNFNDKKVNTYTIPATSSTDSSPRIYSDNGQDENLISRTAGKGYALTGTIYAGEANVKMGGTYGDSNHDDRMALVVAGYYSPDPSTPNTTTLSYYRLDFTEGTNGLTLMDILRGRDYQMIIRSVSGPGKPSVSEALESINADMALVIKTWTPAGQSATTSDGDNWLKATPYNFNIDKWGGSQTATIETNVPVKNGKSWSATVVDGGTWLTLTGDVSITGGVSGDQLRFDVQPVTDPNSSFTRTAKLKITTAPTALGTTMEYSIVVTQTNRDGDHLLRLSHSELVFDGRKWNATTQAWENPDPQELGINWGPRNINYKLTLTDYTGGGVDVDGLAENTETPDNDPAYPVAPLAIDENDPHVAENPFFERSSNLTISAFDQFGANPITKSVRIRQIFYSLVATGTEDYYYQGLSYTINIKSNTAWKATFGGDETIFSSRTGTSGSGNTTAGESFRFTISPSAPVGASATVTFSSADDSNPRFLPQTFTIIVQNYDQPNSYIVAPGAMQPIPVSKVYRVWKLDRDLGDVDLTAKQGVRGAKLLWQDETGLIAGVDYLAINGGTQDIINVRTNTDSKKGNAVVAFTIDGEVYWSWHIWVTDYDPETTYTTYKNVRFMDRNLGAMGDNAAGTAANAYEAYGLYYEWGRKDPFPRAAGVTNSSLKTIFDELGSILTINNNGIVSQMAPAEQNLAPAINNPMIYYAGGFANNSWYGQMLDIRANLWADALKTDFDPCPKGWKVASSANLSGLPMLPDFTTNRGGIFSTSQGSVGFIPATGRIPQQFVGILDQQGMFSYMLTSTADKVAGRIYRIRDDEMVGITMGAAQGGAVRCIKY